MAKRAPNHIIRALEEALRVARMDNFGRLGHVINERGEKIPAAQYLKEQTAPYRESWLIPQIQTALAWAKGEGQQ